ncbi:hypothetical protein MJT46_010730 [Ovis ammon polii x Ovis aries]|nr:hypothetical protein MJT46_010730 [Ovis ammon polii x Ovis aries]
MLVLDTLGAGFGSALQYSYNVEWLTGHTSCPGEQELVSEELLPPQPPALWVLLSLQTGTLQINSVFTIIPAILMGVSKVARAFKMIIFSRAVLGVCTAVLSIMTSSLIPGCVQRPSGGRSLFVFTEQQGLWRNSWGVPLAITVAAVALKKIGYDASDVSVGWCWINLEAEDRVLWMLLTGKLWELLAYVTLPVLYLLIRKHIRRAHAELSEYRPIVSEAHQLQHRTSVADKKLVLIPLIFICLRVWSTVRFVLTLCGSPAVRMPVLVVVLHEKQAESIVESRRAGAIRSEPTIAEMRDMSDDESTGDTVSALGRLTPVIVLATLIAAFGSSFQYGYNVATINSPSEFMKDFYNYTYYDRVGEYMNEFYLTLLWSVTVSMFPFGGFLGSLMVGPLVNNLGRKGTLLFNNIFSIVPALLMGFSDLAKSFEMIIVARVLVGICAGLSSNVVPMYLGELAPKNWRGALGVVPQLFITIGILVAQIFGLRSLLANEEGWPILLGLTGIPAVLQLLFLPFFPESPRYLLIQKKDEEAAKRALRRLRGWHDVDAEIEEILEEDRAEKAAGFISVLKLFKMRSLRWQVISIIVLMAGQQLSGVNAIYYYADQIYLSAGVKEDDVQYVTAGTGAVNVLITVCAIFVVELMGRRFLLLLGFSVCFTACCVLTGALAMQDVISWMPYVSIACVISYVIGHALGPSPIPALLVTEIFLQSSRPAAYMVAGTVHWLSNFTVGLVFPFIQVGLGAYSFVIFAVICFLTTVYIFLIIPETKSKTFIEINQIFIKMNKVPGVHPEKEELKEFPPSTARQ